MAKAAAIALAVLGMARSGATGSESSTTPPEKSCEASPEHAAIEQQIQQIKERRRAAHDSFIAASQACQGASACLKQAQERVAGTYESLNAEQAALVQARMQLSPEGCRGALSTEP